MSDNDNGHHHHSLDLWNVQLSEQRDAMIAHIRARLDAITARKQQALGQYEELEAMLKELDRQICGMAGAEQELSALLAECEQGEGVG